MSITQARAGKASKHLDKKIRYQDHVTTIGGWLQELVNDGYTLDTVMVVDHAKTRRTERAIESMKRGHGGWGPPVNECHPDRIKYEKLRAELIAGYKKPEYRLMNNDGSGRFYTATTTEATHFSGLTNTPQTPGKSINCQPHQR